MPIAETAEPTLIPIGELLALHAKDPEQPAVTFEGRTTTYRELEARSNRKARQLARLGVVHGDVVTVALPNSTEYYETVFAIWKLGATPNSVSSKLPKTEFMAIVDLAQPRLVIANEEARQDVWNFLAGGAEPDASLSDEALPTMVAENWKIVTSGGSTGRPKLIVDRRPALADPTQALLGIAPGDTLLNPGPLYHNAPFVVTTSCLFTGGHVVEMGRFDPLHALELIERYRVAFVNFVPTMMHRIWRLPQEQRESFDLSSLRIVFHMASACPIWLKEAWIKWLGPEKVFELYGGTEGQGITVITGPEWLEHRGSVGRIQPGAKLRVLNEASEDCPPNEVGEIYFLPDAGRGSTYKYVGATPKALGEWESLGDMGYLDADDYLYLVDRRTDLILSGGANVYPAEIEAALDEHPDVSSSIVIGLPDEDLGQRVHAIVQLSDEARTPTDDDALKTFLAERLARYKIPRTFEFTAETLRDDAGKARRSKLREERLSAV